MTIAKESASVITPCPSSQNWKFIQREKKGQNISAQQSQAVGAAFASGAAFVWDEDGIHAFKIFNSTKEVGLSLKLVCCRVEVHVWFACVSLRAV